jgi:hypothetical protein
MSIPSTPNPNTTYVQTANIQNLVSWSYVAGATSYSVQRSSDGGLTYSVVATPVVNYYLDSTPTVNTLYYYRVASVNSDGTSGYTPGQGVVPTISGNLSLASLRLSAFQRADRVGTQFVSLPEANFFINQSAFELYDLLTTLYEDYYVAQPAYFTTDGSTYQFPLPNGIIEFTNQSGSTYVAPPFYKLLGVDLGLNNAPNGFVTVKRFNFIDRNKYVFPNTASTIYGVFNLQYRLVGNNLEFIPVPSGNQPIRIWYIPRLTELLKDTDVLDGINGWTQYVIIRAAKYILDKEESDTSKLDSELAYLTKRIEESGMNRDAGQADTISDTRGNYGVSSQWCPAGFPGGGW